MGFQRDGHLRLGGYSQHNVAAESIVLLKNDNGVLPLDINKIHKLAVIGDNAIRTHGQGGFGASVKTRSEITPLAGLQQSVG